MIETERQLIMVAMLAIFNGLFIATVGAQSAAILGCSIEKWIYKIGGIIFIIIGIGLFILVFGVK